MGNQKEKDEKKNVLYEAEDSGSAHAVLDESNLKDRKTKSGKRAKPEKQSVSTEDRGGDFEEVRAFWTRVMRDEEASVRERLKASEYIAKADAMHMKQAEAERVGSEKDNQICITVDYGEDD